MSLNLDLKEKVRNFCQTKVDIIFALFIIIIPIVFWFFTKDIVAGLTALIAIVALYAPVSAVFKAPHLKILSQEAEKGDKKREPYLDVINIFNAFNISKEESISIPVKKEIYCRPYVRNLGLVEAQHCEVKVKVWEEDKKSPVDYQPLHWACNIPGIGSQTPSEAFKKIKIGFEERLDLLRAFYDFNKNKLILKTYSLKPFELESGSVWEVDIVLTAANSTTDSLSLKVDLTKIKEKIEKFRELANYTANDLKNRGILGVASKDKPLTDRDVVNKAKEIMNYFGQKSNYDVLCGNLSSVLQECIQVDPKRLRKLRR